MDGRNSRKTGQWAKALKEFGLISENLRRERAGFVLKSDKGDVILGKARCGKETILFAHYVKEALAAAGFENTDRFLTTPCGRPYAEGADGLYTLTRHPHGGGAGFAEVCFDKLGDVCKTAREAAKMHRITAKTGFFDSFKGAVPRQREYEVFSSEEGFLRQQRTMRAFRKLAKSRSRLSDFDVKFLKNFDRYEDVCGRAQSLLCFGSGAGGGNALAGGTFSHNLLKEETLLIKNGSVKIIGFDGSSGDHFLFDAAGIIKRFLRMAQSPSAEDLSEIINSYSRENPLSEEHKKLLHALLLFPDKFLKSGIKYYSKKRKFTPESCVAALESGLAADVVGARVVEEYFG